MSLDLGPEFRTVCLALRRPQSLEDMAELRSSVCGVQDWGVIVTAARRHRIAPFLLAGLQACDSPSVPARVFDELRRVTIAGARRSLSQVAEIGRLQQLFTEAGIRVLVLKGVALHAQLYGEQGLRSARDIDLLVDPEQLLQADEVLGRAGYVRRQNLRSPRQYTAYLRWIKELEYYHSGNRGLIELHHRLTDNPNLLACDFGSLWSEREVVRINGIDIPTLARHRLPLYLCLHGGDHGWARLQWLVDFTAALQQSENLDAVVKTAEAARLLWAFAHALMLAHEWLGLPLDNRRAVACRDSAHVKYRDWLLAHLYTRSDWHNAIPKSAWKRAVRYSVWERLYRFSLKSDWRYWGSQVKREWFCPADWDIVPLPEALSWLYPLVRPWGWLIRRLSVS